MPVPSPPTPRGYMERGVKIGCPKKRIPHHQGHNFCGKHTHTHTHTHTQPESITSPPSSLRMKLEKRPVPLGHPYAANFHQPRGIPHPSPRLGGGGGRYVDWCMHYLSLQQHHIGPVKGQYLLLMTITDYIIIGFTSEKGKTTHVDSSQMCTAAAGTFPGRPIRYTRQVGFAFCQACLC